MEQPVHVQRVSGDHVLMDILDSSGRKQVLVLSKEVALQLFHELTRTLDIFSWGGETLPNGEQREMHSQYDPDNLDLNINSGSKH